MTITVADLRAELDRIEDVCCMAKSSPMANDIVRICRALRAAITWDPWEHGLDCGDLGEQHDAILRAWEGE